MAEISRRSQLIRRWARKIALKGRLVIVTDDGVATGATMQAALWTARQEQPEKMVVALPVASQEALYRLSADADGVVCLRLPSNFMAVGQFYMRFNPIEDEDVLEVLKGARRAKAEK